MDRIGERTAPTFTWCSFKKNQFLSKEKCPLSLFWLGSQLPVVLESTGWSAPWLELHRSCGVSGTGGGSAARTVWAQWRASPSPYWSPLLPQEGGLELALGSEHPVPLAVMTPALGSCGDRTAGALQHTLWGLCSLPLGHSALAPVCLTLAVLLLAVRYKADLKFRGINHHYAPVQQILMRQDQGWLLPSLAVISRSKSWPFSNGEDGRRIS